MAIKHQAQTAVNLPSIIIDQYPTSTKVTRPLEWRSHRFELLGIRDTVRHPLTIEQFQARPLLRRSRYQLRVVDLQTGELRTIYHRLLQEHYRECPLRVGVFLGSELVELLSPNWGPTAADRRGLLGFLDRFKVQDMGDHRIGVFSDDGEVITSESFKA